ncbi:MAG: hypothetical protein R3C59_16325 [Planctomycetaceae bacterium]
MSIVRLQKLTLCGRSSQRDAVLSELQELGCMHLLDLSGGDSADSAQPLPVMPAHEAAAEWRAVTEELRAALRYLEACPNRRPASEQDTGYDCYEVVQQVLAIQRQQRRLHDEQVTLKEAIATVRPWGNFTLPSEQDLRGLRLWFYAVRHHQAATISNQDLPCRKISQDSEFEYWVVISAAAPDGIPIAPVSLDPRPLSELQQTLETVRLECERLQLQRLALTRWIHRLESDLAMAGDDAMRREAQRRLWQQSSLFVVQGWVPQHAVAAVRRFATRHELALTLQAPEPEETPPTLLRNPDIVAGAEGAVTFYITPGYDTWDPTWIMYLSFSLFFAMIMADAGYGMVLGLAMLIFWKRLGTTVSRRRRLRSLAAFIVSVTVGYGIVMGSYFGMSPAAGSWLDRFVWKSGSTSIMEDREAMMLLSATIGVVHLMIANLVMALQRGRTSRAFGDVGWMAALAGGWLMVAAQIRNPDLMTSLAESFPGTGRTSLELTETCWKFGSGSLATGLLAVLLFSSDRPLWSAKRSDWLWRPVEGLLALTNLSKAFGDALSYLRLFALGLASAQLAVTFNQLADQASQVRGIGVLLGLMIFTAGHSLNLVLGVVGGVVHGLRLNCIEFFSWSLTDEGMPFRAFRKQADEM